MIISLSAALAFCTFVLFFILASGNIFSVSHSMGVIHSDILPYCEIFFITLSSSSVSTIFQQCCIHFSENYQSLSPTSHISENSHLQVFKNQHISFSVIPHDLPLSSLCKGPSPFHNVVCILVITPMKLCKGQVETPLTPKYIVYLTSFHKI